MAKRLFIKTLGCAMNEHDSEKIAGMLGSMDFVLTDSPDVADLLILNTCAIREKAEQKCFSDLGRWNQLKKQNPNLMIGVAGCVAQQEGKRILDRAPYVDLIFGTDNIHEVPSLLMKRQESSSGVISIQRYKRRHDTPALRRDKTRAWVTVVDGCDKFCTFCVVPQTRGRERSRLPEDILSEVEGLAEEGYKEITLLGQNVNAYGKDLLQPVELADLLLAIHPIEGIKRIRFVTSHPSAFQERLAKTMADLPKVCEALHLPIQSGSDRILAEMRRDYTRQGYREKVRMLKDYIPNITLTSDIIVGFPGETEDDFKKTVDALVEFQFDNIYAFKYSPRPNTAAATMNQPVAEDIRESRLQDILSLQRVISKRKNEALVGQVEELLVEGVDRLGKGRITGRTRGNKITHLESDAGDLQTGDFIPVRVTHATDSSLRGEIVHY